MSRLLVAVTAALVLVPSASASVSAGSSCAHPARWQLSDAQVASIDSTFSHSYEHGPVHVSVDGGDPYGGTIVRAQAGSGWRVCWVRGQYRNGHSWGMPAVAGGGGRPSFAQRRFLRSSPLGAGSVVVSYAHRSSGDGRSCANPLVVYERVGTDGTGDAGARIRTTFAVSAAGSATLTAQWQAATGSHVCEVAGWSSHGHAWHVSGGGDGRHTMYRDVNVGNHDNSVLYLWIAFRR